MNFGTVAGHGSRGKIYGERSGPSVRGRDKSSSIPGKNKTGKIGAQITGVGILEHAGSGIVSDAGRVSALDLRPKGVLCLGEPGCRH